MMSATHNITISHETYELLNEVKKVFASYTGQDIEDFTDEQVVKILAGGFFDTTEDDGCGCGGSCGCGGHDHNHHHDCGCGGHHHEHKHHHHDGCGCGHHH